ncbi:MAG TPA: nucleotide exchange factor GrpE [Candidatus Nanoarchaeia archaeon]|nr:nucleotide exchange factor GrpE [Candidatus Nanoarchaeia archaeon]
MKEKKQEPEKNTEQEKMAPAQEKKEQSAEKIAELTDTLQRLQAEFENYKKYVEKEKEMYRRYAKADIIEKLLPILDSFEFALKNQCDMESFRKGVELIYAQFYGALEKEGLKKIEAKGKLDPNFHEVLLKAPSDKEEDTIIAELQKGYLLNERVLRHTKVKVSKGKDANCAKNSAK